MSGYHRMPALSRDHLVFVCEDDLWIASAGGGVARRLVTGVGEVRNPVLSSDGARVAFNAGPSAEVFICPVDGGVPERLTHEGTPARVIGFRDDDTVLFSSLREGGLRSDAFVYEIRVDGTGRARLPVGRAAHVSFADDGDTVAIGFNSTDSAPWKRYRGGRAGDLWIGSVSKVDHRRLLTLAGNPVMPTVVGERVYFIADHEGFGNVYSVSFAGDDLRAHTTHRDYYARGLRGFGNLLVFQKGGALFRLDTTTDEVTEIEVETRPSGAQLRRKFVDPEEHLQALDLSHDGRKIASTVRGKVLAMTAWGGPVRRLGAWSGVRYKHAQWLHGDREVVVISDESGEECPEVLDAATGKVLVRAEIDGLGRIRDVVASPASRAFLVLDVAGRMALVDLEAGTDAVVAETKNGPVRDVAWSHDGRWVAFVVPDRLWDRCGPLHLLEVATGTVTRVSDELGVREPAFDPHGRFLYVIADRTWNPVMNASQFGFAVVDAARPYAMVLRADQLSPFDARWPDRLEADEKRREREREKAERERAEREERDGKDPKGDVAVEDDVPDPVTIDLDGLADRMVPFPDVEPGAYSDIQAADDKVLFLAWPTLGLLDGDEDDDDLEDDKRPLLVSYDLKTGKQTSIVSGVQTYVARASRTLIWASSVMHLLETGEEPPKDPPVSGHNRQTGTVDLDRLRIEIVPAEEWRQMFLEAWRLAKHHFWTETMAGIDWDEVRDRYLPLVERVATRRELSDLIWELHGELGTSHAYEFGGDYPHVSDYTVGKLGADLSWDGTGWRVDHILEGDTWVPGVGSPLRAPGVRVAVGDRITAIDGRRVTEAFDPQRLLLHQADTDVALTVEPSGGGDAREVVVRTIASERMLRYRDRMLRKRRYVHEKSDGKLGYLHIPDMQGWGLSEFFRAFRSECRKPGLVVDVRANAGGFVSQFIIECLRREVIGYEFPRYGHPDTYPMDAVRGPKVAICDQYAGSDGDIVSHAWKAYGLGPLVGVRTWGGVVGIAPDEHLADGGMVTQPEYSTWMEGVGWDVENHGVDPDEVVELTPADLARGDDPQLDRAIALALEALAANPVVTPTVAGIPSRRVDR